MALKHKIGRPALNLAGDCYGKLTVVKFVPNSSPRKWKCSCTCGRNCTVSQKHLRYGSTKSCGCNVRANALKQTKALTLPPGTAFINSMFSVYKTSANKTGRCFVLTRRQFENRVLKPCYYCGAEPKQPEWAVRVKAIKVRWFNGIPAINGIDRLNSALGYTPKNTVPCCKTCNIAKHTMTPKEFITWARRVAAHTVFYLK